MRGLHAAHEVGMHYVEDDLGQWDKPWEELADEAILAGFDDLLGKHAAFHAYLRETGRL